MPVLYARNPGMFIFVSSPFIRRRVVMMLRIISGRYARELAAPVDISSYIFFGSRKQTAMGGDEPPTT